MPLDLFAQDRLVIGDGAMLLNGFALAEADALIARIADIAAQAPFRHMETPGGRRMSVATTSCGALGWTSSPRGYRYAAYDPETGISWPAMPAVFADLAARAAAGAGYPGFAPDACLVNRYAPGTRLTLHQDRNEIDMTAPIVSVSLGLPATFLWGGAVRSDRPRRIALHHGDVMVWGGPTRLSFHGVDILQNGMHSATGTYRYNLTFRQAGTQEERRC
jgi:alkylated DNA repair protein (DNA oxidative demethylase)